MKRWSISIPVAVLISLGVIGAGASEGLPSTSLLPAEIDPTYAGTLSQILGSDHFIFHLKPGDTSIEVARYEAFHEWATTYLGVTPAKKIDYYKFSSADEMAAALGRPSRGTAYPPEFAMASIYPWQNHECLHLYNSLLSPVPTIRLIKKGMVVAHEFDPWNDDWVSQWNRREVEEPYIYIDMAIEDRAAGWHVPMESILESDGFNEAFAERGMVIYVQAGTFVRYLIDTFGLEAMKSIFRAVAYDDSRENILTAFRASFGVSVADAEAGWQAWLDRLAAEKAE